MKIVQMKTVTEEVFQAMRALIPQLDNTRPLLNKSQLQKICSFSSTRVYVAYADDNKIIGTISLVFTYHPTGYMANIEDFVVNSHYRSRGVGSNLLAFAIDEARAAGVTYVHLTSRPERKIANELYKKFGFKKRKTNVYRYTFSKL